MLNRLTGIRAVAAVFVVLLHFGTTFSTLLPSIKPFSWLYSNGGLGVDLFFILSGFILSLNYMDRFQSVSARQYKAFLRARFARIYPVHFLTLLALTLIVLAAFHAGRPVDAARYTPWEWCENLVLIHAWPGFANKLNWNYPSWSISAEWFAYLLFPLVAAVIGKARRPLLISGLLLGLYILPVSAGWIREGAPSNWMVFKIACEFGSGCLLYEASRRGTRCPLSATWAGLLCIAAVLICSYWHINSPLAVPTFAILIWSLAEHPDGFLGGSIAVYLGEASYSLYMTHGVVQIVLNRVLPPARFVHQPASLRIAVLAIYCTAIIIAMLVFYHGVERPGRRWLVGKRADKRVEAIDSVDAIVVEEITSYAARISRRRAG